MSANSKVVRSERSQTELADREGLLPSGLLTEGERLLRLAPSHGRGWDSWAWVAAAVPPPSC